MMTGQILGGSSPVTAIKYQIMIMIAIFVGCTLNLFLSILLSNRMMFDTYSNLKDIGITSAKRIGGYFRLSSQLIPQEK